MFNYQTKQRERAGTAVQPKLKIGQPGDKYEQEADAVAEQVMTMSDGNPLQMQPMEEEEEMMQPKLRMQPLEEEEEMIQPKIQMQSIAEEENIQMKRNNSLTRDVQNKMESSFGEDFSTVKIHKNSKKADQLSAHAFTQGEQIHFAPKQFNQNTKSGQELLGHELAHIVQQRRGIVGANSRVNGMPVNDEPRFEKEADEMGAKASKNQPVHQNINNNTSLNLLQKQAPIQRDPVSIAGLGLAVFESGRSMLSGGSFSSTANSPSYMHPGTPASAQWVSRTAEAKIRAFHPRIGFGEQFFYFRISYERNGYDLRNVQVVPLKDKSSSMISSSFNIVWGGQAHSRPTNPRAEIVFNISGTWDPIGRGISSFWGQLIVRQSGLTFNVDSEQWVYDRGIWFT